jgi:undecaprenyl diphosphate synthase
MKLFRQTLSDKTAELAEQGIRLRFCGRIGDLPADIRENIEKAEKMTSSLDRMQLIICMNYGGRQEILDAAAKAFANDVSYLDERSFREYLYLPDVPDPDLIIRTSGEMRLSNFFLWQASYAELYFTDVLWPDFDEKDFIDALLAYSKRKRRYGATEGFQK